MPAQRPRPCQQARAETLHARAWTHTTPRAQANLLCIYLGHRDIRATPLPPGHLPRLRRELVTLCSAMTQVLEAPTVSHSRHVLTAAGRRKHVHSLTV